MSIVEKVCIFLERHAVAKRSRGATGKKIFVFRITLWPQEVYFSLTYRKITFQVGSETSQETCKLLLTSSGGNMALHKVEEAGKNAQKVSTVYQPPLLMPARCWSTFVPKSCPSFM